jgi:hypothetical protein
MESLCPPQSRRAFLFNRSTSNPKERRKTCCNSCSIYSSGLPCNGGFGYLSWSSWHYSISSKHLNSPQPLSERIFYFKEITMLKVHILSICSYCNGKAYVPMGEAKDCQGHKYPCTIHRSFHVFGALNYRKQAFLGVNFSA